MSGVIVKYVLMFLRQVYLQNNQAIIKRNSFCLQKISYNICSEVNTIK